MADLIEILKAHGWPTFLVVVLGLFLALCARWVRKRIIEPGADAVIALIHTLRLELPKQTATLKDIDERLERLEEASGGGRSNSRQRRNCEGDD
jgi:hypothetical protein